MRYIRQSTRLNHEHLTRNNIFGICVLWYAVFVVLSLLMCGCGQPQVNMSGQGAISRSGEISKEKLRELLNDFEEFAIANVAQASTQLDELQPDFKTRKMSLIHRTRFSQALHTMLDRDDPIEAFIETWALSVRITNYFKDGEGEHIFGEHQGMVITTSEILQAEIEKIGRRFLKDDTFIETQRKINNFAQTNPMTGTFSNTILYVTEVKTDQPGLFDNVVSIPLAPFKAMTGVDRTASAIYGLRDSADNISDVIEEFPESAKWQLLLLLMEIGEIEVVKSFLASMSTFSDSSVRFADSAEKLPKQLRQELSILIQEIDDKQANLQTTLEKTEKTAVAVEQALGEASKVAASFQTTAESVNQAATAWEKAAIATDKTLAEFNKFKTPRKGAAAKSPFSIKDYQDTAESVGKTVNEIHKLIESKQLSQYSSMPRKIANHLAWKLGQLIFLIFILAVIYRVVIIRFANKPGKNR